MVGKVRSKVAPTAEEPLREQFVLLGEQNALSETQAEPEFTVCPSEENTQCTVSPGWMVTSAGLNVKPACPTKTVKVVNGVITSVKVPSAAWRARRGRVVPPTTAVCSTPPRENRPDTTPRGISPAGRRPGAA